MTTRPAERDRDLGSDSTAVVAYRLLSVGLASVLATPGKVALRLVPPGRQPIARPVGIHSVTGRPVEGQSVWSFVNFKNNPCHEYSGGEGQAQTVLTGQHPLQVGFTVHPSAIPSGAGVQIVANSNVGDYPQQQGPMALFEWLVQASPQCTGS
jgi:hypothetical protein